MKKESVNRTFVH